MSLAEAVQPRISESQANSPYVYLAFDLPAALAERRREWWDAYNPRAGEETWLYEQMIHNSVRIDLCHRELEFTRESLARRATLCWDSDQRLAAEELARGLAKNPGRTVARLLATKQGCALLVERWKALGKIAEEGGESAWTESRIRTAFELLGVPEDERFETPWPAHVSGVAFVARKVAELERLRDGTLDALDRDSRDAARRGHEFPSSKLLDAIRRREAAHLKRFEWFRAELRRRRNESPAPSIPAKPVAPPPPPKEPVAAKEVVPVPASRPTSIPVFAPQSPSLAESFLGHSGPATLNRHQRRAEQKAAKRR